MDLIIAEKFSAYKEYINFLTTHFNQSFKRLEVYSISQDYIITFTSGHIIELCEPEAYDTKYSQWSEEDLPIFPVKWKYQVVKDKKPTFKIIKDSIPQVSRIINACDIGREGELIAGLIFKLIPTKVPRFRLLHQDFESASILQGFNNLIPYEDRVHIENSGLGRMHADWLVGLNISRKIACQYNAFNLSVGRVQTPVLKLIYDQEQLVLNWTHSENYQLQFHYKEALFTHYNSDNRTKFETKDDIADIISSIVPPISITSVDVKQKLTNPNKPLYLKELQKQANNKFLYTAEKTLSLAQSLYEKKIISYPRTDCPYITEALLPSSYDLALQLIKKRNLNLELVKPKSDKFHFVDDSKVVDHYALMPTYSALSPAEISKDEAAILELITDAFITSFCKPKIESVLTIQASSASHHNFLSRNTSLIDSGYTSLLKDVSESKTVLDTTSFPMNSTIPNPEFIINTVEAKKPTFHTEGSLLDAMETAGKRIKDPILKEAMKERSLGQSATQASIIETLKKRQYIELEKSKYLRVTQRGNNLLKVCHPDLQSPILTGQWEYKLNLVSKGELDINEFEEQVRNFTSELLNKQVQEQSINLSEAILPDNVCCPECKEKNYQFSKHGFFCQSCDFKLFRKQYGKKLNDSQLIDLLTKKKTKKISGLKKSKGDGTYSAYLNLEKDKVTVSF